MTEPTAFGCLPRICGADLELANFYLGTGDGCVERAAEALLRAMPGTRPRGAADVVETVQDSGRKWSAENGGCYYIDLNHLELAIPEVWSAIDHVAHTHAALRTAQLGAREVNRSCRAGERLVVLANNSDGHGHSYGSHLNFLIKRSTWRELMERRLQVLMFLAAFQASACVITGQGKVGAENGRPWVPFQISQRADFIEVLAAEQTTFRRPLVNTRNEALCGSVGEIPGARLHVIAFDHNLCHVAGFLKVGMFQCFLALLECDVLDISLLLDDPVDAMGVWSRDPTLRSPARLVSGGAITAVDWQRRLFDLVTRNRHRIALDRSVPDLDLLLRTWVGVLDELAARDFAALRPKLDWVLKRSLLGDAIESGGKRRWDAPEIRYLDQIYSDLDPEHGLFWSAARSGMVEEMVSSETIEQCRTAPPENTRAWRRAMLLRCADPEDLARVDWDEVVFFAEGPDGPSRWTVGLPDPALGKTTITDSDANPPIAGVAEREERIR